MTDFKINGDTYTEEMYKRDLIRMFDSSRKYCESHPEMGCENCLFKNGDECDDINNRESFKNVMRVYKWSKHHPVVTNRDKMIETFGGSYFNLIINYISDRSLEDYDTWLNEEYKEDEKND